MALASTDLASGLARMLRTSAVKLAPDARFHKWDDVLTRHRAAGADRNSRAGETWYWTVDWLTRLSGNLRLREANAIFNRIPYRADSEI